jgi:hypothetical protein
MVLTMGGIRPFTNPHTDAGECEKGLAALFAEARRLSPSLLVVDEVDALVPRHENAPDMERHVSGLFLHLVDRLLADAQSPVALIGTLRGFVCLGGYLLSRTDCNRMPAACSSNPEVPHR